MKWFLSGACQCTGDSLPNGKSKRRTNSTMTNNYYNSEEKTDQFKDKDEIITIRKMETTWYKDGDKSMAMQYMKTN
jgi:hypothetical protein